MCFLAPRSNIAMKTAVPPAKYQLSVLQVTLIVALGGLLMGYDAATVATSQMYFTQYFGFSSVQQGWVISSAGYGCFLGAISAGYLTSVLSRKYTLILAEVLYVISAIGSGIADSLMILVSYRLILGLSIGMIAMTSPMYIAEISPSHIRGKMVTYHQLAMVVGFILPFLLSFLMRNEGQAVRRADLFDHIWGFDYLGDTRSLDVHIHSLRKKVEQNPSKPCYIQTVRGVGYRFASTMA